MTKKYIFKLTQRIDNKTITCTVCVTAYVKVTENFAGSICIAGIMESELT